MKVWNYDCGLKFMSCKLVEVKKNKNWHLKFVVILKITGMQPHGANLVGDQLWLPVE